MNFSNFKSLQKSSFVFAICAFRLGAYAYDPDIIFYHGDVHTRASDFSKEFFGNSRGDSRAQQINFGNVGVNLSSELDCGNIDIKANLSAEFNELQTQVKQIIPTAKDMPRFVEKAVLLSTCYAYPTVCAQLRHDFLALKANLNLRSQACRAIDNFIDSQSEKGAMQLRAEAKAKCISDAVKGGKDTASAVTECQQVTGLPIRDFQAGLEKRFTRNKQKVLESIVKFAKSTNTHMYTFLALFLGEIEVQVDGYWQPLFTNGMLMPDDIAQEFLVEGENKVCSDIADIVFKRINPQNTEFEKAIVETIQKRITKEDVLNIEDLGDGDRALACSALGRSVGQIAAQKASAEGEAIVASGLLNTSIPSALRDEYRMRTSAAFLAIQKTLESDQILPLDEVRGAISQLAYATREKNRIIAAQISESKIQNSRQQSIIKYDCIDTLSCGG